MNIKKTTALILTLLLICMMFISCDKPIGDDSDASDAVTTTEEATPEPEDTPEPEGTPEPETTAAEVSDAATTQAQAGAGEISDDWTDCQFAFDGVVYTLPHLYSDFVTNGWTINLADYGYADGYIMNKGDKVYSTIEFHNSKFDEDMRVCVGFINKGDAAADITECSIWAINCDSRYGTRALENIPSLTLSKGITWGSTEEEVVAAYGEPDEIYESDLGYKAYSYVSGDYNFDLNIYEDGGLSYFSIENFE